MGNTDLSGVLQQDRGDRPAGGSSGSSDAAARQRTMSVWSAGQPRVKRVFNKTARVKRVSNKTARVKRVSNKTAQREARVSNKDSLSGSESVQKNRPRLVRRWLSGRPKAMPGRSECMQQNSSVRLERVEEDNQDDWNVWKKTTRTTETCGRRQPGRLERVKKDKQDDWNVWKKTTRTTGTCGRRQPGRLERVEENNQDDWNVWKKTIQNGGSV